MHESSTTADSSQCCNAQQHAIATLFILTFIYFLENFDRYLLAVSPIPYIDYSSYEYSLLSGTVFSLFYSCGAVAMSVLGHDDDDSSMAANRTRMSGILTLACLIFSICFTCAAVATNFWQQAAIRMVMGLAQSVVTPYSIGIISILFDDTWSSSPSTSKNNSIEVHESETVNRKALAFGIYNYGVYLAFSLSLSIGTLVYDAYGWQADYVIFGALGIVFSFIVPWTGTRHGGSDKSGEASDVSIGTHIHGEDNDVSTAVADMPNQTEQDSLIQGKMMREHRDRSDASQRGNDLEENDSTGGVDLPSSTLCRTMCTRVTKGCGLIWRIWCSWGKRFPVVMTLLILATGTRMGGGMIWVTYLAVYYSEYFVSDSNDNTCTADGAASGSSCDFSYNATYIPQPNDASGAVYCSHSNYPYCNSDNTCVQLNDTPWQNVGMSHETLELYMFWVPLVGSAMGCLLGGWVSDALQAPAVRRDAKKEWVYAPLNPESSGSDAANEVDPSNQPTAVNDCKTTSIWHGPGGRSMVAGCGILLSVPFVYYALTLKTYSHDSNGNNGIPWCFVMLIFSGLVRNTDVLKLVPTMVSYISVVLSLHMIGCRGL